MTLSYKTGLSQKYPLVVIDVETTGLSPEWHEIISFCGIKYNAKTRRETMFSCKFKPRRPETIDPKAVEVNGYNEKDWENASDPRETVHQIKSFLNGCTVIGHNVSFDIKFLSAFFSQMGTHPPLIYRHIDTVTLAHEHLVPCGLQSLSMDSIRDFMGYPRNPYHSARQDAKDCYKLYNSLSRAGSMKRLYWSLRHQLRERRKNAIH